MEESGERLGAIELVATDNSEPTSNVAMRGRSRWSASLSRNAKVTALFALVALAIRLYQIFQPGHLLGATQYDDGVYFGAALQLVHGVLPYRSFVLVEPPGIAVLFAPIAVLGSWIGSRDALALARIVMAFIDPVNVVLLGVLLRKKKTAAVAIATAFLACNGASIATSLSVAQEPILDLLCLLGLVLVFDGDELTASRRNWLLAGLCFGLGASVKTWAAFPFLALVLIGLGSNRRRVLDAIGAALASFLVVCAVFIVASPGGFWRDVIEVQFGRTDVVRASVENRLASMTGAWLTQYPALVYGTCVAIALLVVVAYLGPPRRPSPLGAFSLCSCGLIIVALLIPDDFYLNYGALLGPFLAIAVGLSAGIVLERARYAGAISLIVVGGLSVHGVYFASSWDRNIPFDPSAQIEAEVPAGSCVLSDSVIVLILANRFDPHAGGCPDVVDGYGTDLVLANGYTYAAGGDISPVVEQAWLYDVTHADYLVFTSRADSTIPPTASIINALHRDFVHESPYVGRAFPPYAGIYRRKVVP